MNTKYKTPTMKYKNEKDKDKKQRPNTKPKKQIKSRQETSLVRKGDGG